MADMQYVEAPIRQKNPLTCTSPFRDTPLELFPVENLLRLDQCGLAVGRGCSSVASSSCAVTVAVPRFITTSPPA